ncbi:MAG: MerR family transcriptional regulator [Alphaproteobacteria bacterium]|nr:MerR family transcriptional regulator [Alphaproteobacteria bacterium]
MSSAAFAYSPKSAEAFRTISEVADELDVPQHVLRFWESRFAQIRPVKRAGGRRYYRPEDIDLIKGVRALLYDEGFTIKGVQKVLKERGVRHVAGLGRNGAAPAAEPEPVVIEKIVYVEKTAAKKRSTHLRAVPTQEMTLPFFDMPEAESEAPAAPQIIRADETRDAPQAPDVAEVDEPVMDASDWDEANLAPDLECGAGEAQAYAGDDLDDVDVADAAAEEAVADEDGMAAEDRARLEEILDELTGLKTRLVTARASIQPAA